VALSHLLPARGPVDLARKPSPIKATTTSLAPLTRGATPTAATTTTEARPPAPAISEYEAAKRRWLGSDPYGGGAGQNAALPIAVNDLQMGELADPGSKSGYPMAIADLTTIARTPDAMLTPRDAAQWEAAADALNTFFAIPQTAPSNVFASPQRAPPYNVHCGIVPNTAAAAAWNEEPSGDSSGVLIEPLKQAAADLEPQENTNPCYAAGIDDLSALQSASKGMIAQSYAASWNSGSAVLAVACEIGYLNQLFEAEALNHANDRLE
jgi:hypothetical protein